ncbi:predicted protein [Plenodomus lingam JN3]|uniref:Predicted protein n=1 Tax=Leptosphaeria maculans (strain JN3 / isolate v23.1.3 / race Av1-4-5-6-7-8) TaxID=985895 RepID=E4ZJG1_LEPMJ|nr:predicted protein [Plenodomus lingam JN3]CBX91592.1 predicted protein [Plenodomus lingam JN3]
MLPRPRELFFMETARWLDVIPDALERFWLRQLSFCTCISLVFVCCRHDSMFLVMW